MLGLLVIVTAVITVLEIANGPGWGPGGYAHPRGYDQVKVSVQRSFPIRFLVGLGGLGLTMLGARALARREEPWTDPDAEERFAPGPSCGRSRRRTGRSSRSSSASAGPAAAAGAWPGG